MKNIKEILSSLRTEINIYRNDRINLYISADILAVEIALNLTEFALKKNRAIEKNEEIWFDASYALAYSFDGTKWENVYIYYKELVNYTEAQGYFRNCIPKIEWES